MVKEGIRGSVGSSLCPAVWCQGQSLQVCRGGPHLLTELGQLLAQPPADKQRARPREPCVGQGKAHPELWLQPPGGTNTAP